MINSGRPRNKTNFEEFLKVFVLLVWYWQRLEWVRADLTKRSLQDEMDQLRVKFETEAKRNGIIWLKCCTEVNRPQEMKRKAFRRPDLSNEGMMNETIYVQN